MTPKASQIRSANSNDLPALIELYQHLAEVDEKPETSVAAEIFERFAAYPGSEIIVAENDDSLVATCALIVVPNLTRGGKSFAIIENVVTHCDFRNLGLGKQVLAYAVDAARTAGCYKVMLLTGSQKAET